MRFRWGVLVLISVAFFAALYAFYPQMTKPSVASELPSSWHARHTVLHQLAEPDVRPPATPAAPHRALPHPTTPRRTPA